MKRRGPVASGAKAVPEMLRAEGNPLGPLTRLSIFSGVAWDLEIFLVFVFVVEPDEVFHQVF